jgi:dipeptidyl aminopeptidase/acylaminoacyl peptidase
MSFSLAPRTVVAWLVGLALFTSPAARAQPKGGGPNYLLHEFRHSNLVWAVTFSPDGKTIAGGAEDRVILTWDIATGKQLQKMNADGSVCLVWSPDGKLLASAPGGGARKHDPQLWDPATGKEVRRCVGHTEICYFIAFSPDSKLLASASVDRTVRLWDVATAKEVRSMRGHTNTVLRVAYSPDGKTIASVSDDQTVRLWDAATGKEKLVMTGHSGQVLAVNFSPDSRLVVSGGGDGTVRLWDVSSGREVRRFTSPTPQQVATVCFSRDGRNVAAGMANGTASLIEVATGRERWPFRANPSHVYSVTFSPDGKTLATGGGDCMVRLWDYTAPGRDTKPETGAFTDEALTRLWRDLGSDNAGTAYAAVGTLAGAGDGAGVRWIKDKLKPAAGPAKAAASAEKIPQLIADLDDDDFEVREKASAALRMLDRIPEAAMRKAVVGTKSAEVKQRLEKLLERLDSTTIPPEELLAIRAVEVLERVGSAEAKEVLRGLAKGHESARLTQEAKAALGRISPR